MIDFNYTPPLLPIIHISYARRERLFLPQIEDEHAFMGYLKGKGVKHRSGIFEPSLLRAVQSEINLEKVVGIARNWNPASHIVVAVDSRILDGHHRWWAARLLDMPVRAVQVYAPHTSLIKLANEWEGVTHHGI